MIRLIETEFTFPCGEVIEIQVCEDYISDGGQLENWVQSALAHSPGYYKNRFDKIINSIRFANGCYFVDEKINTTIKTKPSEEVAIASLIQCLIQLSTLFYYGE